ncbi:hypothetical protein V6N13_134463 [Hibiscus sabdariffa]
MSVCKLQAVFTINSRFRAEAFRSLISYRQSRRGRRKMVSRTDPNASESVIVVMDGKRSKGMADSLDWALNNCVRRKDTVIVIGVLGEMVKKNATHCFPLNMGINISGILEKLEFSISSGHTEVKTKDAGEEIERKREQYRAILQPFTRKCKRNEVKLEVKIAAGICPIEITLKEALNSNTRWIVLDSHLKKYKMCIYWNVECNVAVMKGKDVATLLPSRAPKPDYSPLSSERADAETCPDDQPLNDPENGEPNVVEEAESPILETPRGPAWYPLQNRAGYPREFSFGEIEEITNGFSDIICDISAIKLTWRARWYTAIEIGGSLRYLHEECPEGPIVHRSVCSSNIVYSHGYSPMLSNFITAKWHKGEVPSDVNSNGKCPNLEEDKRVYVDIHDYGLFLVELISGKVSGCFPHENEGQSLKDWSWNSPVLHVVTEGLSGHRRTQIAPPRAIPEIKSHTNTTLEVYNRLLVDNTLERIGNPSEVTFSTVVRSFAKKMFMHYHVLHTQRLILGSAATASKRISHSTDGSKIGGQRRRFEGHSLYGPGGFALSEE